MVTKTTTDKLSYIFKCNVWEPRVTLILGKTLHIPGPLVWLLGHANETTVVVEGWRG